MHAVRIAYTVPDAESAATGAHLAWVSVKGMESIEVGGGSSLTIGMAHCA